MTAAEAFVTLDGVDHAYASAGSTLAVEGLSISVKQGRSSCCGSASALCRRC
jgi:hypothetical protein